MALSDRRQSQVRQRRLDWLRGRCHTMTSAEAAAELRCSKRAAQQYAKELGEQYLDSGVPPEPPPSMETVEAEIIERSRRVASLWRTTT